MVIEINISTTIVLTLIGFIIILVDMLVQWWMILTKKERIIDLRLRWLGLIVILFCMCCLILTCTNTL